VWTNSATIEFSNTTGREGSQPASRSLHETSCIVISRASLPVDPQLSLFIRTDRNNTGGRKPLKNKLVLNPLVN
jgi:hypothetical protein